jgi:serine kinase of HPr protein (carbohydrate metabolism regulator)
LDGVTSIAHGTCIALDGRAALLRGPSRSGKSDLALRCITLGLTLGKRALRADLVADDGVMVERRGRCLLVRPPDAIKGKLEVRGLGIIEVSFVPEAELVLLVPLMPFEEIERLPDPRAAEEVLGVMLPVLPVDAFEAAAPQKVLLALAGV